MADFKLKMKFPQQRKPDQRWILYGLESPKRTKLPWDRIEGLFNWTMTYREDSDIPVRYGEICRETSSASQKNHDYLQGKNKDTVWIVSHCSTPSKREKYVEELRRFISVDIYGRCGNNVCLPSQSSKCYEKLFKEYKFYLSFENSICKDYVTEKFFNALNYDIVPVVFGGADYRSLAPPGAFINSLDYPDPRKLAEHLKLVGSNSTLYNEHFQWKDKYKITLQRWMCDLCEKLQTNSTVSIKFNLYQWFVEQANCKIWDSDNNFRNPELSKEELLMKLVETTTR
ncbi:alpha-(1,3)-fucosyltransferase C-like [Limulus polyphemus]|uniref:Fucosyltransferase n=1 Tax=Limulus polyphemus TaxID=6850 RepID=A0ABM1BQV8_LIMPO|nr:alpha-(1,3)-fucosyltransferase C-like [Limulus polyphemus]